MESGQAVLVEYDGEVETEDEDQRSKAMVVFDKLGDGGRVSLGALLAIIVGLILNVCGVKDPTLYRLIVLPGTVWLNGLQMIVLPLIMSNMVCSMVSIRALPNSRGLALKTFAYYLSTTLVAVGIGLVVVNVVLVPRMEVIDVHAEGTDEQDDFNFDTNKTEDERTLVDQIEGVFTGMVPPNIVDAAATSNLIGVIVFSILLGIFLPPGENRIFDLFEELGVVLLLMIQKLVLLTPVGVFFLMLPNFATVDLVVIAKYVGLLLATIITGMVLHVLFFYPVLFFVLTRRNPFTHMKNAAPAFVTALGVSSSAATLPVTMRCAAENGVRETIAEFVLPLGATVNMDGTAIAFPCIVIFLAGAQGIDFGIQDMILLALITTLGSMGAAPIPNAGSVMLLVIMNTVGVPVTGLFGLILAINWLEDRMETAVNVMGDSFAVGVINHFTPEETPEDVPVDDYIVEDDDIPMCATAHSVQVSEGGNEVSEGR